MIFVKALKVLTSLSPSKLEGVARSDGGVCLTKARSKVCRTKKPPEERLGRFFVQNMRLPYLPSLALTARSISSVILARSQSGLQPHSSRAQVSSSLLGQLREISSFTGSTA